MRKAYRFFIDLIENHKFMRRMILTWWMVAASFATYQTFTWPEIAAVTANQYMSLVGAGAVMTGFYFKTRPTDGKGPIGLEGTIDQFS
jgi:hypothetical protein